LRCVFAFEILKTKTKTKTETNSGPYTFSINQKQRATDSSHLSIFGGGSGSGNANNQLETIFTHASAVFSSNTLLMPNSLQFAVCDEKPQNPASADSTVREGSLQEPLQSRHSARGTDRHRLSIHARYKQPTVCRNPCSRNKTWAARTFALGYQIRSTNQEPRTTTT